MPEKSPLSVFFRQEGTFFFFWQKGNAKFLTFMHIYRKYHISMYFLIKIIFFHFPSKEKISYFPEKRNTILPDITKKTVIKREFFRKTIFPEHLKKTSYFQVVFLRRIPARFFWKDHLSKTSGKKYTVFRAVDGEKNECIFDWRWLFLRKV